MEYSFSGVDLGVPAKIFFLIYVCTVYVDAKGTGSLKETYPNKTGILNGTWAGYYNNAR